jgi:hypothetical protein
MKNYTGSMYMLGVLALSGANISDALHLVSSTPVRLRGRIVRLEGPIVAPSKPTDPPALHKAYTEHLGKLTSGPGKGGVNDLGLLGMTGTDLGSSFELGGKLVFLFGDSWGPAGSSVVDEDSVAWTDARTVDRFKMPRLTWSSSGGKPIAPLVSGISQRGMEVPVEGLEVGGKPYVFFVTGWTGSGYRQSALAHSEVTSGGGVAADRFKLDHVVESNRFLNVSVVQEAGYAYIFGAGNPYRASSVYLARVPVGDIANRSKWTYFKGTNGAGPAFGAMEDVAADLIQSPCVGELSVRKHAATGLYLMAYNCEIDGKRGYHLRTARAPWGPWSASELMFDVGTDPAYGVTQHILSDSKTATDDGLGEQGTFWGGEYGPYLVPRWFTSKGKVHTLVYAHSSWNPYKVHLLRTVLTEAGATAVAAPVYGKVAATHDFVNPQFDALAGWKKTGPAFMPFKVGDRSCVTSFLPTLGGDAVVGSIYQDITLSSTASRIRFTMHGGHGAAKLALHGEIVRESHGPDDNAVNVPVEWNVEEFRGETVRFSFDDSYTDGWGFVSACDLQLVGQ